jgi:hypothetical protein
MECNDIKEKLSAHIDNQLSVEEHALIDKHLKNCSHCSLVYEEFKQTVARMKGLEEVEPPSWLEQKIVAKVREEAEQKKGFLQKLLYPLHVKIPLQAAATVAICVVAFFVFKTIEPEIKQSALTPEKSAVMEDDSLEESADIASEQYAAKKLGKEKATDLKEEDRGLIYTPAMPRSRETGRVATEDKRTVPEKIRETEMLMSKAKKGEPYSGLPEEAPASPHVYKKDKDTSDSPRITITLSYLSDLAETNKQQDSDRYEVTSGVMLESDSETVSNPEATFTGTLSPQLIRSFDGTHDVYSVTINVEDSHYYLADSVGEEVRHELDRELDSFMGALRAWKHILSEEEVNKLRQEKMLLLNVKEPRSILRRFHSKELAVTVTWKEEWN